ASTVVAKDPPPTKPGFTGLHSFAEFGRSRLNSGRSARSIGKSTIVSRTTIERPVTQSLSCQCTSRKPPASALDDPSSPPKAPSSAANKQWTSCWRGQDTNYIMPDTFPLPKAPNNFSNFKRACERPGISSWDRYLLEVSYKKACCLEESPPKLADRKADLNPEMDNLYGHHRYWELPAIDDTEDEAAATSPDAVDWEYIHTFPRCIIFGAIDAGVKKGYVHDQKQGTIKTQRIKWLGPSSDWASNEEGKRVRKDNGETWKQWEKKAPYKKMQTLPGGSSSSSATGGTGSSSMMMAQRKTQRPPEPNYPLFRPQLLPKLR
ncbi:hypothetical protein LTS18_005297, partial [Coniosporium uncinatum]